MSYSVTLHDGTYGGETVTVGEPWPRHTIWVRIGTDPLEPYVLQDAGPPYHADYLPVTDPEEDPGETPAGPVEGPTGAPGPEGPPGPQGEPGEPGSQVVHQGAWDPDTVYSATDIVTHDGASWFSTGDLNEGNEPGASYNWNVLAEQGPPGTGGVEAYQQLDEPTTSTVGAIWIVQAP